MPFGFLVTCFGVTHIRWLHFSRATFREKWDLHAKFVSLCSFTLTFFFLMNLSRNNADHSIFVRFSRRISAAYKKDNANIRRNFGQSDVYASMSDDLLPRRQFRHAEFSVSKLFTAVASYRIPSRRDDCEWSICCLRSSREKSFCLKTVLYHGL